MHDALNMEVGGLFQPLAQSRSKSAEHLRMRCPHQRETSQVLQASRPFGWLGQATQGGQERSGPVCTYSLPSERMYSSAC
jgi:hypothetical protein